MYFKLWLEDYEKHRAGIEIAALSRTFPFEKWFDGKERIYLPFEGNTQSEEGDDKDVIDVVRDFKGGGKLPESPIGYEVIDYVKGHAIPKGGRPNRIYKISAILQATLDKDLADVESQHQAGNLSGIKYEKEKASTMKYGTELIRSFQNSPQRIKQKEYLVVITHNIHDIAKMSTDRNWTSCTNLDDGSNKKSVYCEVKNGGFVAYLINKDDLEIKEPKARIWIRRFDKKDKKSGGVNSIAMPEESVYGDDVPGFVDFVKNWIASKQKIKYGTYTKRGGPYSDTFGKKELVMPEDEKRLIKQLQKLSALPNEKKASNISTIRAILEKLTSMKTLMPETTKFIYDLLKNTNYGKTYLTNLLKNHPELGTAEDFSDFGGYDLEKVYGNAPPQTKVGIRQQTITHLMANLDYPSPAVHSSGSPETYQEMGRYQDLLNKALILSPLPEPIIQKMIALHNKLESNPISNKEQRKLAVSVLPDHGKYEEGITNQILHVFYMTKADTPSVVRFYQQLVQKRGGFHFGDYKLSSFAYALAGLGINGRPFLPALKQELAQVTGSKPKQFDLEKSDDEHKGWKAIMNRRELDKVPKSAEIYNYVIDSIETGTGRSSKYTMY